MAKTEVILIQNIVGLGGESDQVRVAAGYARNYLFPQGMAVPLTSANKRRIEALKQRRGEREAHEFSTMSELSKSLANLIAVLAVKTGEDGKMFGAVTTGMIADQLKTQFDIVLEKRKIYLEHPIKTLGEHAVELRLHPQVTATLKVRIESTTPLPAPPPQPAPSEVREGRESRARTESRGHRRAEETAAPAAAETPARPEKKSRAPKAEKPDKHEKPEKPDKHEKAEKHEKSEKPDKREKSEKAK
jgi:large subunit ribosomal protein L9